MSKIIARIQQFAENKGVSIRELERNSGATNGVFSKAIRLGSEISTDKLENFLQAYPLISAEWLMRGLGEMMIQPEESSEKNPTLDFVIRNMASQIEELKTKVRELESKNDKLRDERDNLIKDNLKMEAKLDFARKGEIASIVAGSSDARAV